MIGMTAMNRMTARTGMNRTREEEGRSHRRDGELRLALALVVAAAALPACADRIATETQACPCATGNFCCASGVCASDEVGCGDATLALATENAGTWAGYLENTALPSGSDAIRVSLNVVGAEVSGELVLGTAPPPPVPTEAVYPSNFAPGGWVLDPSLLDPVRYVEGFVYHARDIAWESRRLKFTVDLAEAWQATCALYQPITVAGETFICPGGYGFSAEGGCNLANGMPNTEFDCKYLAPCEPGSQCHCDATTCTPAGGTISVDVALRGDLGDGSLIGIAPSGGATNLRLMRTKP